MNMTAPAPANDLDGHKLDPIPSPNERQQHFRLDYEVVGLQRHAGPGLEIDQPKTALGVREKLPGAFGKPAAHPAIDLTAQPRDSLRIMHAITDNQPDVGLFGTGEERRQVLRSMLPITVHRQAPLESPRERCGQAGLECRALAEVPRMADHRRACRRSQRRGVIRRTVIHDQHEG